jgi:Rad3-related DNA helicase
LIRRRTDRGVFVILDSRVRTASYGSRFTRSIPVPVTPTESLDDAVEQALRWFDPPVAPDGDGVSIE